MRGKVAHEKPGVGVRLGKGIEPQDALRIKKNQQDLLAAVESVKSSQEIVEL